MHSPSSGIWQYFISTPSAWSLTGFPSAHGFLGLSKVPWYGVLRPRHPSWQLARPGGSARGTGGFFCLGLRVACTPELLESTLVITAGDNTLHPYLTL